MAESPESQISDPIFDRFEEGSDILSSRDTIATPDSEISPPESPLEKHAILDPRTKSRQLAASLSLEEQVKFLCFVDCTLLMNFSGLSTSGCRFLEIKINSFQRHTSIQDIRWPKW